MGAELTAVVLGKAITSRMVGAPANAMISLQNAYESRASECFQNIQTPSAVSGAFGTKDIPSLSHQFATAATKLMAQQLKAQIDRQAPIQSKGYAAVGGRPRLQGIQQEPKLGAGGFVAHADVPEDLLLHLALVDAKAAA